MILQQDLAVLEGTMVSVGFARPAINNLGSVDAMMATSLPERRSAVQLPDLAAMQRVPAVMDFNILVDMGRMDP